MNYSDILHLSSWDIIACNDICLYYLDGRDFAKAVVDLEKKEMILWVSMHVDAEESFLSHESKQENLWWINIYVESFGTDDFIEYDSMINIRPRQNNRSRDVEDPIVRKEIQQLVLSFLAQ